MNGQHPIFECEFVVLCTENSQARQFFSNEMYLFISVVCPDSFLACKLFAVVVTALAANLKIMIGDS